MIYNEYNVSNVQGTLGEDFVTNRSYLPMASFSRMDSYNGAQTDRKMFLFRKYGDKAFRKECKAK